MSSIREALFKQRQEGDLPHSGGGHYPAPPRRQPRRGWPQLLLAGLAGALLVGAATWFYRTQEAPAVAAAPTPPPTPAATLAPTASPIPTVVVVAATPTVDHAAQLRQELDRLRQEVRAMEARPRLEEPRRALPTRPPTAPPPPAAKPPAQSPPFRLEGTIGSGNSTAAFINGEVYRVGDVIAGRKILAIGKNWVQCEGYPGYIEVSPESAPDRPAAPEPAR